MAQNKPIQIWNYPEPKTGTEQREQMVEGICDSFFALSSEQQRTLLQQALEGNNTGSLFGLVEMIDDYTK